MAESKVDDDRRFIPEELIWEILIRVPVKSLMRFKCVSRRWRSFILNPIFARAYRGGFKGLLLSKPYNWGLAYHQDFFYLNILDDDDDAPKQIFHHHTVVHDKKMASTVPMNGLVCFYNGNYSYMYNIATRESMVLPASIMISGHALTISVSIPLAGCTSYSRYAQFTRSTTTRSKKAMLFFVI